MTALQPPEPRVPDDVLSCCTTTLVEGPLTVEAATELAGLLKALSDPARLRLYSMIASHPDGEVCVCDLTAPIGLTQPTVSHHLKLLLDAGLLARERRGNWAYYRAVPDTLSRLADALAGHRHA